MFIINNPIQTLCCVSQAYRGSSGVQPCLSECTVKSVAQKLARCCHSLLQDPTALPHIREIPAVRPRLTSPSPVLPTRITAARRSPASTRATHFPTHTHPETHPLCAQAPFTRRPRPKACTRHPSCHPRTHASVPVVARSLNASSAPAHRHQPWLSTSTGRRCWRTPRARETCSQRR